MHYLVLNTYISVKAIIFVLIVGTPRGLWRGYGTCGATNLTLEASIRLLAGGDVNGTIEFTYGDVNAMMVIQGVYREASRDIAIVLDTWVSQPPPELSFSLIGIYDATLDTIRGEMSGRLCSGDDPFMLTRSEDCEYHLCME